MGNLVNMITTKDISKRYTLSTKQVRSLVEAVSPVLADDIARGPHNTILIQESAVHVLDRAMELRREGGSWPAIGDQLAKELSEISNETQGQADKPKRQTANELASTIRANSLPDALPLDKTVLELIKTKDELVDELRQQLADLKNDKEWLQDRVKDLEQHALPSESKTRKKVSRLKALKAALTGKI